MKSATSTVYEQLHRQKSIFMPKLKEPHFFSDDRIYQKGINWYAGLFSGASSDQLTGEASTSYTKYPTYPCAAERIYQHNPHVKLIYIIRHPIDRLISHYGHARTMNEIRDSVNMAIKKYPELIEYSLFCRQLSVYERFFKREQILPIFFERLISFPKIEFSKIAAFLELEESFVYYPALERVNETSQRLRTIPMQGLLIDSKFSETLRRYFVPQWIRDRIKERLKIKEKPVLNQESLDTLFRHFEPDIQQLGVKFGIDLSLENYKEVVLSSNCMTGWGNKL